MLFLTINYRFIITSISALYAGLSDLCLKLFSVGSCEDVSSSEETSFQDMMMHTNTIAVQRGGRKNGSHSFRCPSVQLLEEGCAFGRGLPQLPGFPNFGNAMAPIENNAGSKPK